MQKVIIKHLGPIKELEMEIKDFNLLIGEQATGKSTVAKAIYFFRSIKATLQDYLCQLYDTSLYNGNDINGGFNKVLRKELKSVFVSLFGYSWDLDERLYLKYEYADDIWISTQLYGRATKQYISVQYSGKLTREIKKLEKEALDLYVQKKDMTYLSLAYASKERLRNYDNFKKSLNQIFDDNKETYYIPAGRSMLTLLVNNRSLIESNNLDLITRQYMQIIDNIHGVFEDGIRNAHKRYPDEERKFDVNKITDTLVANLKGDYQYIAGKEYIIIQDEEKHKENAFVIIEEPEAHLYPSLQNKVVEFIAYFANMNNSSVLITTHSPYILTSVNALYCAGKVLDSGKVSSKKVYDIIGTGCEIRPEKITALKIGRHKDIINLINDEFKEVSTELIDEISDDINDKYTELFYLISENDEM